MVRPLCGLAGVEVAGPDLSLVEVRTERLVPQLTFSEPESLTSPALPAAGTEDRPVAPDLRGGLLLLPDLHRAACPAVAPLPGEVLAVTGGAGGAPRTVVPVLGVLPGALAVEDAFVQEGEHAGHVGEESAEKIITGDRSDFTYCLTSQ